MKLHPNTPNIRQKALVAGATLASMGGLATSASAEVPNAAPAKPHHNVTHNDKDVWQPVLTHEQTVGKLRDSLGMLTRSVMAFTEGSGPDSQNPAVSTSHTETDGYITGDVTEVTSDEYRGGKVHKTVLSVFRRYGDADQATGKPSAGDPYRFQIATYEAPADRNGKLTGDLKSVSFFGIGENTPGEIAVNNSVFTASDRVKSLSFDTGRAVGPHSVRANANTVDSLVVRASKTANYVIKQV